MRVWILCVTRIVMPCRSDGTLNQGLVRIECAPSNTDLNDPDAHRGREFVRAGYTQIPSIGEAKYPQKQRRNRMYLANSKRITAVQCIHTGYGEREEEEEEEFHT